MPVYSSGVIAIASGVTSTGIVVVETALLDILSGGLAIEAGASGGGAIVVSAGGTLNVCTVSPGGTVTVLENGYASNVAVAGGLYIVSGGGYAAKSEVRSGGVMQVFADVRVTAVDVQNGGTLEVNEDGYARAPILSQGGLIRVNCGLLDSVGIAGTAVIDSGGVVSSSTVLDGGELRIAGDDSFAMKIGISSGGTVRVSGGGMLFMASMFEGASAVVSEGGLAASVKLDGGRLDLLSGGSLEDAAVNSGAGLFVFGGGTAVDAAVRSGGRLDVFSGGRLTGAQTFEPGAAVSMCEGAVLDFDVSELPPGQGAIARVSDLSRVQGTPVYTLTVSASQPYGAYALADGAAAFSGTLSVTGTDGGFFGRLAIGESIRIGDAGYSLDLNGSVLTLTVGTPEVIPTDLVGSQDRLSWQMTGAEQYFVECSTDAFGHAVRIPVSGSAVDLLELPAGTYRWRVMADGGREWAVGEAFDSDGGTAAPTAVRSNEDGCDDLFFASANGTWDSLYYAMHVGFLDDGWTGTNDLVSAAGKCRIQNLFFGSADPNVLCLSDADNGDAVFVDDVYTDLPEGMTDQTARLYRIQEIRAGAGDDIVDMTSQRFAYVGDGQTIRGGDGNDTIWANKGDNLLFGDAGNDRIVGASGNDVIAGGVGNDSMHGGGGNDVFAFCENWGADTVRQLETGSVTLWFASGGIGNWDPVSLTYTDGENSVTVSGVAADRVSLKFGDDGSDRFAALSGAGAFDAFTSQRIFEESGAGILAKQ
ncbi:MAG: hypothetical protein J6Y92_04765 [Lentisphaeria bacterium]|nr:hypothetical protein [Lentisphaeria bacterium]